MNNELIINSYLIIACIMNSELTRCNTSFEKKKKKIKEGTPEI